MDFLVRHTAPSRIRLGAEGESNAEVIYRKIRSGDPQAVNYYLNLKKRIADGKRAEMVMAAIRAVHEAQKAPQPEIGAVGYLTPSGHVLTAQAVSQLAAACYAACGR